MDQKITSSSNLKKGIISVNKNISQNTSSPISLRQVSQFLLYIMIIAIYLVQIYFFYNAPIENRVHTFYFNAISILLVQVPFLIYLQFMGTFPLIRKNYLFKILSLVYVIANLTPTLLTYVGIISIDNLLLPLYYFAISMVTLIISLLIIFVNRIEMRNYVNQTIFRTIILFASQCVLLLTFVYQSVLDTNFGVLSPPLINIIIMCVTILVTIIFSFVLMFLFWKISNSISENYWSNWFALSSYAISFLVIIIFSVINWNTNVIFDVSLILTMGFGVSAVIFSLVSIWLLYKKPSLKYVYEFILIILIMVTLISQAAAPISYGESSMFPAINYLIGSGLSLFALIIFALSPGSRVISQREILIEMIGFFALIVFDSLIMIDIFFGVSIINNFLAIDTIFIMSNIIFALLILSSRVFAMASSNAKVIVSPKKAK